MEIEFNEKEMELLTKAGVKIEEKGYTKEDLKRAESSIEEFIMIHSTKEIGKISKEYNGILNKIIQYE